MGLMLSLHAEPAVPSPPQEWRDRWVREAPDSRYLVEFLSAVDDPQWLSLGGERGSFGHALGIDVAPLCKTAGQDLGVEDYAEWCSEEDAERLWREDTARDAAAWQPPAELVRCLRAVLAALDVHPRVVEGVRDPYGYYAAGLLRASLTELLEQAEWDAAHGAQRVRLVIA
jgi:hypothetical protein